MDGTALSPPELAARFFDTLNREGIGATTGMLDETVEWHTDPRVPEPGVYRGRERVMTYIEGLLAPWEQWRMEPQEFIEANEDTVVAHVKASGLLRGTSARAELDWWLVGTFREGRLLQIKSFLNDRAGALRSAGVER
jgi:ketosteroid isomerase-like protein